MELEQIKGIWEKASVEEKQGYFISQDKLRDLIHAKSNSAVSQIKRKVKMKMVMAGIISILMIIFGFFALQTDEISVLSIGNITDDLIRKEIGFIYIVFGIVVGAISILNGISFRRMNELEEKSVDLKSYMNSILAILKRAMNAKIYSNSIVIPVTILILIISQGLRNSTLWSTKTMAMAFGFGVFFFAFSFFVTRWGQYKRYGAHIKEIEDCLDELEES
jgi:hypothetical protein